MCKYLCACACGPSCVASVLLVCTYVHVHAALRVGAPCFLLVVAPLLSLPIYITEKEKREKERERKREREREREHQVVAPLFSLPKYIYRERESVCV
jgi:hypothetical protein